MGDFTILLKQRDLLSPLPLPAAARVEVLRFAWDRAGGPSWAALRVTGSRDAVAEALEWLRAGVEVFSPEGERVWWGYVRSVRCGLGALAAEVTLEGMANEVAARYRQAVRSGDDVLYRDAVTPWATDLASTDEFGLMQRLLRTTLTDPELALAQAGAALAANSLPATGVSSLAAGEGAGGAVWALVWCRGWYDTLDWVYYSQPAGLVEHVAANGVQTVGLARTGAAIGFVGRTREICDVDAGLGRFKQGDTIVVSNAGADSGVYTVWQGTAQPQLVYTATTIGFASQGGGVWRVTDSAGGLGGLARGDWVRIAGSQSNDGYVRVESAAGDGTSFDCWQYLYTEAAGRAVTLTRGHSIRVQEPVSDRSPGDSPVTVAAYGLKLAASFTMPDPGGWAARRVSIRAARAGAPADSLSVALCPDVGGGPGAPLGSASVGGASLGLSPAWIELALPADVALAGAAPYWLVIERTGQANEAGYYLVGVDDNAGYAGGSLLVWGAAGYVARAPASDLAFRVSGRQEVTEQIARVVAKCGQYLTGCELACGPTGLAVDQYRPGDATGLAELERLLAAGGLQARVAADRGLVVEAVPAASEVAYLLGSDGRLSLPGGQAVPAGTCPVGVWAALGDLVPGSADVSHYARVSPFFVARSVYDCRAGRLRLYPRGAAGGTASDTTDEIGELTV